MILTIPDQLISAAITIIIAVAQAMILKTMKKIQIDNENAKKSAEAESRAIKDGVKSLLGESIDRMVKKMLSSDEPMEVLQSDWKRILGLYEAYTTLGGNGVIKAEMDTLSEYYNDRLLDK